MKGLILFFLFSILYISSTYGASCKAAEGDPYAPHPRPTQRVYRYDPADPSLDTSPDGGNRLNVLSYNIQSGLTLKCAFQPEAQAQFMKNQHFFGLQEVDMFITMRCNCSQPKLFADYTGHTVLFLHTIFYRTGFYGSALSSAFPILETRYKMFTQFSTEERGVLAIRTTPPQVGGRTLWMMNTHLQFDSEYTRMKQAEDVVALAQEILNDYPEALIIATGDYYVTPGLNSYALLNSFFENAWSVFHGSDDGGETYPADWPGNRFDHIWYRFPEGTKYTVTVEVIRSLLSDHTPLQAFFTFDSLPTGTPTPTPTIIPTPTITPTTTPTVEPTSTPTLAPTPAPTSAPTLAPTSAPTLAPTSAPTLAPTSAPTSAPTLAPTLAPEPTPEATPIPTPTPTSNPSDSSSSGDSDSSSTATTALSAATSNSATAATTATTAGTTASATATTEYTSSQPTTGGAATSDAAATTGGAATSASATTATTSVEPTPGPSDPTTPPVTPTTPPTTPTEAPSTPTQAPTTPTEAPSTPTQAPSTPTEAPTTPTQAPTTPTQDPTTPTQDPSAPTQDPSAPTQTPTTPTETPTLSPVDPTATPAPTSTPTDPATDAPTTAPTDPATDAPTTAPTDAASTTDTPPGPPLNQPNGSSEPATSVAASFTVSPLVIAATAICLVIYM